MACVSCSTTDFPERTGFAVKLRQVFSKSVKKLLYKPEYKKFFFPEIAAQKSRSRLIEEALLQLIILNRISHVE
jgi:hypothetical protein